MRKLWALVGGLLAACQEPAPAPPAAERLAPPSAPPSAERAPPSAPGRAETPAGSPKYPWLDRPSLEPKPVDSLHERFAPPPGFDRVALPPRSFGAWLRRLPLAAASTPVRAYDGRTLHLATDPRIAAVIALDVSKSDLQQCADTVIRLHAEWRWSEGAHDMSYRAAAGLELPWARWARGERLVLEGASIRWQPGSRPVQDHVAFRKYLDAFFAWANTVSLEKQSQRVQPAEVRPGDFFILPGNPGHVVLLLDVAKGGDELVALLGQSFMPAQNAQVLRPAGGGPWFRLDPSKDVDTPFWKPFPWASLRRLPE